MLLEVCLSILTLVATAAIVKVVWFAPRKFAQGAETKKESHDRIDVPPAIYVLRSRPVFHVEGCWHIRDKQPDMYKMCDDCLQKLKKS